MVTKNRKKSLSDCSLKFPPLLLLIAQPLSSPLLHTSHFSKFLDAWLHTQKNKQRLHTPTFFLTVLHTAHPGCHITWICVSEDVCIRSGLVLFSPSVPLPVDFSYNFCSSGSPSRSLGQKHSWTHRWNSWCSSAAASRKKWWKDACFS